MSATAVSSCVSRDLGGGLVLRRAVPADAGALATFNAQIHCRPDGQPDERVGAWTRDLMERPHPTFRVSDFVVIEDTRSGAIVSCLNLIPQTWSYGGIAFGVGRVELVATHPDYRRRGLVRRLFEVIHARSDEDGHLAQAITGIPWFYRQFGYEMCLALGGGRGGSRFRMPKSGEGAAEPFQVRPAVAADLPFVAYIDEQARRRYLVTCVRDAALWRYELDGRSEQNLQRTELLVIECAAGAARQTVGFVALSPEPGPRLTVTSYELAPGVPWLEVTPSVVRYLDAAGEARAQETEDSRFEGFHFALGVEHPVYRVLSSRLPNTVRPYAWYVRMPDLARFLRHVTSVLEARLAASEARGYSGELLLSFYRHGLRLAFAAGRIESVTAWSPPSHRAAGATFPDLTFLQLLFGYRPLEELEYAFADCRARTDAARALLNALFPKQPSLVWPVA